MSDTFWQGLAMAVYLIAMLVIGWYSYRRTHNLGDYMLGGRDLSPSVAALSAGAADMSGWLLMGLPGAIYATGLIEAWIAVGLTVGAWLNWKFVAPRLRAYTQVANNSITVPSFFDNRLRDTSRSLRIASGIIILVFFTFYVSSGMVAGGVFFEGAFGWDYRSGMLLVAAVEVTYTLVGGFLAVSYTDFVQGLMMMTALILVPVFGMVAVGGFGGFADAVNAADAQEGLQRLAVLPPELTGAAVIGLISAVAWGLGYVGQPHIIVRFMALRSAADATAGRRIGIGWMILSISGAVMTGIVGVAYFQEQGWTHLQGPESETIYLRLGQVFFHPLVAGFMLAAVLAAIMSTVASQLIVTSSALVEDVYKALGREEKPDRHYVFMGRLAVLGVSLLAIALAWNQSDTILALVAFAWAGFGASFGPIVVLSLYWRKLTAAGALAGMVTGAVIVGVWGNQLFGEEGIFALYEIVPGFLGNLIVAVVVSLLTFRPRPEIDEEFDRTLAMVRAGRDGEAAAARAPETA